FRSLHVTAGPSAMSNFDFRSRLETTRYRTYAATSTRPGSSPVRSCWPTDVPAMPAYTTMMMLGGMSCPPLPAMSTEVRAIRFGYPARSISGSAIRPSAYAMPTLDPLAAPIAAPATFVVTARPPGSQLSHAPAPRYSLLVMEERHSRKPMRMNIGRTLIDQSAAESYGVFFSADTSPTEP